jgi:hypothetical protein
MSAFGATVMMAGLSLACSQGPSPGAPPSPPLSSVSATPLMTASVIASAPAPPAAPPEPVEEPTLTDEQVRSLLKPWSEHWGKPAYVEVYREGSALSRWVFRSCLPFDKVLMERVRARAEKDPVKKNANARVIEMVNALGGEKIEGMEPALVQACADAKVRLQQAFGLGFKIPSIRAHLGRVVKAASQAFNKNGKFCPPTTRPAPSSWDEGVFRRTKSDEDDAAWVCMELAPPKYSPEPNVVLE